MNTLSSLLLCATLLQVPPAQSAIQSARPDAERFAVAIDGEPIPWAEVGSWLVRFQGEFNAATFRRNFLVHRAALNEGLAATDDEVEAAVNEQIDERVRSAFNGDASGWLDELRSLGLTEASYRAQKNIDRRYELELDRLVRAHRTITEEQIENEWERQFGLGGRTLTLRKIQLDIEYPVRMPGETSDQSRIKREKIENDAIDRARALRKQILDGADFEALARKESDDEVTRARGGRMSVGFDARGWNDQALASVYGLKPNEITDPIYAFGSVHLFQLLSATTTELESARAGVIAHLKASGVVISEVEAYLQDVLVGRPTVLDEMVAENGHERMDATVLEIEGTSIKRRDYAQWLSLKLGQTLAGDFVQHRLVADKAAAMSFAVSEEEIAQRVQDDLLLKVEFMFKGDIAGWEADLVRRGQSRRMYENQAAVRARADLLAEKILLSEREITAEDLRATWEERYGPGGRTVRARLIMKAVKLPQIEDGTPPDEVIRLRDKAHEETKNELEKLRERVEDGEDFAALAMRYSDDEKTRENGGVLERPLNSMPWPNEFLDAIDAAGVGDLTAPLRENDTWFLFEILSDETVPLASVREELTTHLRTTRPDSVVVAGYLNTLLKSHEYGVLPGMFE